MEYIIQGKKLIWDFDKNVSDARKWKDDNLFIEGIWNMKVVGDNVECIKKRITK